MNHLADRGSEPLVRLQEICKAFPGIRANHRVNLEIHAGEIQAILGENGAGKTTLMNVLGGLYRPDSGRIFVAGREVRFAGPRESMDAGIGMVHQHFALVPSMTVTENVFLGLKRPRFSFDSRRNNKAVAEMARHHHLEVTPTTPAWQLSVGEQQRVEILKLLVRGARILILDEPTAVLTPQESDSLFETLRGMAVEDRAVVVISHKLEEVIRHARSISVMRKGELVAHDLDAAEQTPAGLARLMVGHDVDLAGRASPGPAGKTVLSIDDAWVKGDRQEWKLKGFRLSIRTGEIVGLAGIAGNGQRELAEVISGHREPDRGIIQFEGNDLAGTNPRERLNRGIASIPEDRRLVGTSPHLSVRDNLILTRFRRPQFSRRGLLDRTGISRHAESLVQHYNIRVSSLESEVRLLSGGNLQKVILARELSSNPRFLVAAYPTRGVDIGATGQIHSILVSRRNAGAAILLISEDLDELTALSDRIAVIFDGRNVGELPGNSANRRDLGLLMTGVTIDL
jgi:general nucleoside transport system ATP-binding protein